MARRQHQYGVRALQWLVASRSRNLLRLVVLLVPVGVVGYMATADLDPLDALYQTLITLSTVGYQDLADTLPGRVFSIVFMAVGVGVFVVTLSTLAMVAGHGTVSEAAAGTFLRMIADAVAIGIDKPVNRAVDAGAVTRSVPVGAAAAVRLSLGCRRKCKHHGQHERHQHCCCILLRHDPCSCLVTASPP